MSLSEAYGGKPDYTILSFAQFRQDMEKMGSNDKAIRDYCTVRIDDDLQLTDLIASIKNLPLQQNGTNIIVSPDLQQ